MGYSKNYIMYWGVTSSILAYPLPVYNTKDSQILQFSISEFVHFIQLQLFARFFRLRIKGIKE